MSRPLPPLHVSTLGSFGVRQGQALLPENAWGREKALELFLYFLTTPFQLHHKEKVAFELWPEADQDQGERDFKVALNALNSALEPERPARSHARYLERQGASYGLAKTAGTWLDYLEFEEQALAASRLPPQRAADAYRGALAIYRGDYLPDQLRRDWTAATRERLQGLFLTSATELARLLVQAGDYVEPVAWCERAVETDPLWEEAYRLLMRCHLAQGNRPQAVRAYRKLETLLGSSLGLSPMQGTQALYQEALADG